MVGDGLVKGFLKDMVLKDCGGNFLMVIVVVLVDLDLDESCVEV